MIRAETIRAAAWPFPRDEMGSEGAILARMTEDILALYRRTPHVNMPPGANDMIALGWPPSVAVRFFPAAFERAATIAYADLRHEPPLFRFEIEPPPLAPIAPAPPRPKPFDWRGFALGFWASLALYFVSVAALAALGVSL